MELCCGHPEHLGDKGPWGVAAKHFGNRSHFWCWAGSLPIVPPDLSPTFPHPAAWLGKLLFLDTSKGSPDLWLPIGFGGKREDREVRNPDPPSEVNMSWSHPCIHSYPGQAAPSILLLS